MTIGMKMRLAMTTVTFGGVAMMLSGCLGSPTYGTGTSATEQLLTDLGDAASIRPQQGSNIEYRPRPDLVQPADTRSLPQPQQSVASTEAWPESPEETRQRLLAEAEEGNPTRRSPLARQSGTVQRSTGSVRGPVAGRDATQGLANGDEAQARFRAMQNVSRGSDPTTRRYLSEPPVAYRQPAASAPIGDVGETERTKERERLRAARGQSQRRQWLPF